MRLVLTRTYAFTEEKFHDQGSGLGVALRDTHVIRFRPVSGLVTGPTDLETNNTLILLPVFRVAALAMRPSQRL